MLTFIHELLFVLFFLGLLSVCGGFAVSPFHQILRYPVLLTPFVGLLVLVFGVSCFYSLGHISVLFSTVLTFIICSTLTLFTLISRNKYFYRSIKLPLSFTIFLIVFIGFITYINCFSSIELNQPAFLYTDGADHLGYSQVADWLRTHLFSELPPSNLQPSMPNALYESWPANMLYTDPRFGSFFTLAIVSLFHQTSGMFSYDVTCAVILTTSYLGIAAVFARTRLTFILLCLGLLTNYWFVYAQSGFLAKILAYPSTLILIGLFLTIKRPFSIAQIAILSLIAAVSACMYYAPATAAFFGMASIIFVLLNFSHREYLKENLIVLSFLLFIVIITTGLLASPVILHPISNPIPWTFQSIFPVLFDLEKFGSVMPLLPYKFIISLTIIYIVINLLFLIIALKKENYASAALLITPLLLLNFLIAHKVYWTLQLIGIFYTWFLCAGIRLVDEALLTSQRKRFHLLMLYMFVIIMHLPFFYGAIKHYVDSERNIQFVYTQQDMEKLIHFAKHKKVNIDIDQGKLILPLTAEIGSIHPESLQYSPQAWNVTFHRYSNWIRPNFPETPYRIILWRDVVPKNCHIVVKTKQYYGLECSKV